MDFRCFSIIPANAAIQFYRPVFGQRLNENENIEVSYK